MTGTSGQIGRFLSQKLFENKKSFIGLDVIEPKNVEFSFIKADLGRKTEIEKFKNELNEIDTLIHLATKVNSSDDIIENGIESIDMNLNNTLNLIEILPCLKHICFTSSYMVYGKPMTNPVSENHRTEPMNTYGVSKLITEKFLQVFANKKNIELTILRFMGIYGLENPYVKQAIPSFIENIEHDKNPIIFGTGSARRNHIYIDDAIDAILASLNQKNSGVFNMGGPDAPSNLELIDIINKNMNKEIEPVFKNSENEEYDFISDTHNANSKLNFKAKICIKKGIEKSIERNRKFTRNDL